MINDRNNSSFLAFSATILFVLFGFFGVIHHELWLDEANTYLSSRDTKNWSEFYQVFRSEGNPILWFLLVKFWVMMGGGYVGMQVIHMLLMAATIYLIWKYSPFIIIEKFAISTGYFFIYEYSLISRNYALGLLLLLIALILFQKKKLLPALIVSFFCFQTHLHFFLLSFILSAFFIVFEKKNVGKGKLSLGVFIILLGIFILLFQLKDSGEHGYFQNPEFRAFSSLVVQRAFIIPLRALFPLGDPCNFSRDGNLLLLLPKVFILVPALIAFIYPVIILKKYKLALLYYITALTSILFISCISAQPTIQLRHCGTVWIAFIVGLWILRNNNTDRLLNNNLIFYKVSRIFLLITIGMHIYMAVLALYMDFKYPFSEGKNTAAWIKKNGNDELIVCAHHFSGPSIATYLDRQLYYPETKRLGTYCIWNTSPFMVTTVQLKQQIAELVNNNKSSFILILNNENELPIPDSSYSIIPLVRFDKSIVMSENFFIYRIEPTYCSID